VEDDQQSSFAERQIHLTPMSLVGAVKPYRLQDETVLGVNGRRKIQCHDRSTLCNWSCVVIRAQSANFFSSAASFQPKPKSTKDYFLPRFTLLHTSIDQSNFPLLEQEISPVKNARGIYKSNGIQYTCKLNKILIVQSKCRRIIAVTGHVTGNLLS